MLPDYVLKNVSIALSVLEYELCNYRDIKRNLEDISESKNIKVKMDKFFELKRDVLLRLKILGYLKLEGFYNQRIKTSDGKLKTRRVFKYLFNDTVIYSIDLICKLRKKMYLGDIDGLLKPENLFPNVHFEEALFMLNHFLNHKSITKSYYSTERKLVEIERLRVWRDVHKNGFIREEKVINKKMEFLNSHNGKYPKNQPILVTKSKEGRKVVYKIVDGIIRYNVSKELNLEKVYVDIMSF